MVKTNEDQAKPNQVIWIKKTYKYHMLAAVSSTNKPGRPNSALDLLRPRRELEVVMFVTSPSGRRWSIGRKQLPPLWYSISNIIKTNMINEVSSHVYVYG